jgi:predicted DNA-binding transcriptional regulator YafY
MAKERGVLELEISETDIVYKSLLHYENHIRILKGQQILSNIKNNVELKRQAFRKIRGYIRNTENCL